MKSNLVLIGMPGAGKSTVGVIVAKRLGFAFTDTDLVVQQREGRRLQEILDRDGLAAFLVKEEEALLNLHATRTVIATGGSAVYSDKAMQELTKNGIVVFLDLPLDELAPRLHDMADRGLVVTPGETLDDLYRRRLPLYRRYAEVTVDCRGKSIEDVAAEIAAHHGVRALFRDQPAAD